MEPLVTIAIPDLAGPAALVEAGMRLYVDVTPVVRDRLGRRIFERITAVGEARSTAVYTRVSCAQTRSQSRPNSASGALLRGSGSDSQRDAIQDAEHPERDNERARIHPGNDQPVDESQAGSQSQPERQ